MSKSFEMQQGMGMQQEGESDEIKRVFIEGNPYLLVGVGMRDIQRVSWTVAVTG